ncbi:hypothetical protein D3C81_690390 [compost metagenome]
MRAFLQDAFGRSEPGMPGHHRIPFMSSDPRHCNPAIFRHISLNTITVMENVSVVTGSRDGHIPVGLDISGIPFGKLCTLFNLNLDRNNTTIFKIIDAEQARLTGVFHWIQD